MEIIVETMKPDFVIFSETHLTIDVNDEETQLEGYKQYTTLSNSTRTGGVTIYFSKRWNVRKVAEKVIESKIWITAYMVKRNNNEFIVTAIYRSPSSAEVEFLESFEEILDDISEMNCDIVIAGDFNIDWSKESFYKNKLKCLLDDNGLKQVMKDFTRITENSKTLIDYIISNNQNISAEINIANKISDHETIDIIIDNAEYNDNANSYREVELFKYNKYQYNREIQNIQQISESNDLDYNVYFFDECLENAIKRLTTKKIIKENFKCKWFNDEIRHWKREKINKYQIARIANTTEAWANYKALRNFYKVKVENEKNKYINNKINNAKDQKEMWRKIKSLILKKAHNPIETVIFDQIEYKENYQIASMFNKYFISSIKSIRDEIQSVQYAGNIPVINSQFKFRAISIEELKIICKGVKNKSDYNKITSRMLLDNWNLVGKIMLDIINTSLEKGVFPASWKTSMITPIEKVSKTKKCEEFRPINTLKTCEKIMEQVVKEQLEQYMESNKILSKYQSGFRKKYSCETTVNYLINRWKKIENRNKIVGVFLDFRRAFETIDRHILIQKLFSYGIRDIELQWFKSYLKDRRQITKVNNIKSNIINNDYGVPQGSILGALLFIIYINDMPNILDKCEIILYADDTLIYTEGESNRQCYDNLALDMEKVNVWLNMNKLKLNENKTKLMEVNTTSTEIFRINNQIIEKVDQIKYLGFIIDKDLKFKTHIDYICKKIGKKIGFFKRVRKQISILTAINIYNTIIKPHFEFGSTILYTCCTAHQLERLQKMQNRAMRIILKCSRYTSTHFMLESLKWLNIRQRLKLNTLKFIRKMRRNEAPEYLTEQIIYVKEAQPYQLRNMEHFRIARVSTTAMQRSLFYKGLQLYNSLPNNVQNETNHNVFIKHVTHFVKHDLS